MQYRVEGVIAAMVTPMTRKGNEVDLEKTRAVAEFLADEGVQGLFVCGTTGEGPLMLAAERRAVITTVIEAVGSRLNIIAHTGGTDTAETIALTCHARDSGARAAAVVAPGYYPFNNRALARYFGDIATAAVGFPVLLYNIPGCTRNTIPVDLTLHLAQRYENIVGIKDSSGDMAAMTRLLAGVPEDFSVVTGSDLTMFQALVSGAHAVVSGPANFTAPLCVALYDHVRKGKLDLAWKMQTDLVKVVEVLDGGAGMAAYKEGLKLRGVDAGWVRPPLCVLSEADKKKLEEALRTVHLIT